MPKGSRDAAHAHASAGGPDTESPIEMAGQSLTSSLVVRLIDQVTAPARAVTKSLLGLNNAAKGNFGDRLRTAIDNNNAALDRARGSVIDAAAGFYILKSALTAPIKSAVDFESAMADIGKVSGFDAKGLDEYGKRLRKLAVTEIPLAVNDLAALSAAAAQAGVPDADLFDFTRLVAKAAVAWEMSGAEAGEALAKIRTALGLTNEETAAFADAINYVSDSTAASAPDMIDFSKRVASQGEFFGFAKEETLAFGAAMISAGAESEVAATSFRNMGRALTKGASATKSQRGAWKTLGMDAKKVAKAMQKDAVGTTLKVIEKLGQLPEHMQASVMSDLFGDEARALAPLLNNVELLRKALALTADEQSYLNSVGKEFEKRAATSAYKLQRFKSQLGDIALTIGGALLPALTKLLGPLGDIALKFSAWAEANPELVRNIIAATSALVGFRIAIAGLRFIGLMGRGGLLSIMAIGFNTVGRAIIGATRAARGATALQTALAAMSGARYSGIAKTVDALKAMALAIPGVSGIATALGAVGSALATISAPAWGLIAVGVGLVAAAGAAMWKYWDRISSVVSGVARAIGEELQPVFTHFAPALEPVRMALDGIGTAFSYLGEKVSEVAGWIGSFFDKEILSESQKAGIEQGAYDLTKRIVAAIKSIGPAMLAAGAEIMQQLLAGIQQVGAQIVEYVSGLGARIKSSISGAASGLIDRITGGGGGEPANDNSGGGQVSGHRKSGGPVSRGGSYVVGDGGEPEIFTPKTGGSITPMSQAGGVGSITIGDIIVNGASDPRETARIVRDTLRDELRDAMRGIHADLGDR